MSLISYPAIVSGSIIPTIVNFGATFFAKHELAKVRGLFFVVIKPILITGLLLVFVIFVFSESIGDFFKIYNSSLIAIAAVSTFIGFIATVNTGLLQAKLSFHFLAIANLIAASSKLVVGLILVFLGFEIFGAMWAVFLSFLLPYVVSFIPLRFLFNKGLAAATTLGATSFISVDMILVKHFFDPHQAGLYAVLSLIGRVIFYFTAPIGTVMFPLVVQKYEKKEDYSGIFKLSLILVLVPSVMLTTFYFLFPEFTVEFFSKKKESLVVAPYLGYFGIFTTIYSLVSVLVNYFLSINKTKIFIPTCIGAIMQAVLIWFFHQTFIQIIVISTMSVSLLLFVLLLYYWMLSRDKK
jgi:O-antigen/teichoic acid export membrane protein